VAELAIPPREVTCGRANLDVGQLSGGQPVPHFDRKRSQARRVIMPYRVARLTYFLGDRFTRCSCLSLRSSHAPLAWLQLTASARDFLTVLARRWHEQSMRPGPPHSQNRRAVPAWWLGFIDSRGLGGVASRHLSSTPPYHHLPWRF
jgi:hypothetical protein